MFLSAIGHSPDVDTSDAIDSAIARAAARLNGRTARAGILFVGDGYDAKVAVERVREEHDGLSLVGFTTGGELSRESGQTDASIELVLFASDSLEFRTGVGHSISEDPDGAAASAVSSARGDVLQLPELCLAFPANRPAGLARALERLQDELPGVPVIGGVATPPIGGGADRQVYGDEVLEDALPILLFYGPAKIAWAVATGGKPIGEEYVITGSLGRFVRTIDERPALEVIERFLGTTILGSLSELPLSVRAEGREPFLSRILSVDALTGSVELATDPPEGARVRFQSSSRDEIVEASARAMGIAVDRYGEGAPEVALVFSCTGRRRLLGSRAPEEGRVLLETLGSCGLGATQVAGCFAEGEIAPGEINPSCSYRDHSAVVLLIGEDPT